MQSTLRGGLLALGVVAAVVGSARAAAAEPSPDKTAAGQLVALVNQERVAAGLSPLGLSDVAIEVAEAWSVHMATTGKLAHNDGWFSPETKARAGAAAAGENVAYNVDVADAHRRLMESPAHRANVLDPRFHLLGIGVVRGAEGSWWITEDFLQLRVVDDAGGGAAPLVPEPAPSPPLGPPPSGPPPAARPSPSLPPTPSAVPVELANGAPSTPATTTMTAADGEDKPNAEPGGGWEQARDAIDAAGGRSFVTPPARSDVVPADVVGMAAAGILVNLAALAHRRRRSLTATGKDGKIASS